MNRISGLTMESGCFRHSEFRPGRCILRVSCATAAGMRALRMAGVGWAEIRFEYRVCFWVQPNGLGEVERAWRD